MVSLFWGVWAVWGSVLLALEVVCGACDCFTVGGRGSLEPFPCVKQIDLRKRKTVKRKSQPPDLILTRTFTILLCEQPNEVRAVAVNEVNGTSTQMKTHLD
jgi:hypothetical protein